MTQTDGEKELVLGNKQLISLFFVMVALCGVFFAMGYIIGRNTSKSALSILDGNVPAVAPAPIPAVTQSQVTPARDSEPPRETALEDTQTPGNLLSDPQPASAQGVSIQSASQNASAPGASAHGVSMKTQAAQDTPAVPQSGSTWLQITALRRADADNLVKTLREQNFPAFLAGSSRPDLFRVVVGPYRQVADVADAKARLKALGFANAFVQK
jgi:cell division septation protein DedD